MSLKLAHRMTGNLVEKSLVLSLIELHPWYFPDVSPPRLHARDVLKRVPILWHVIIFTGLNFRSGIHVFQLYFIQSMKFRSTVRLHWLCLPLSVWQAHIGYTWLENLLTHFIILKRDPHWIYFPWNLPTQAVTALFPNLKEC